MFCVNVNIPELCFEMQLCYVEMVRSFIVVLCFVRLIQNSVSLGLIFFSHYQSSTFLSAMPNIPWIMILLWLMGKKLLVLWKLKAFFSVPFECPSPPDCEVVFLCKYTDQYSVENLRRTSVDIQNCLSVKLSSVWHFPVNLNYLTLSYFFNLLPQQLLFSTWNTPSVCYGQEILIRK